jgi:hypothetical protein
VRLSLEEHGMWKAIGLALVVALVGCKKGGSGAGGTIIATGGTGLPTGTGGVVPGTGGTVGGTGGTGTAGSGSVASAGCAAADMTMTPSALHAGALNVLASPATCAISTSCHKGTSARANLNLLGVTDLRAVLVGKPACEAPNLALIDGSGGDLALARSYLWLKLTGPVDLSAALTGDPSWGTNPACGQQPGQPYGLRMPMTGTAMLLEDPRLVAVRDWICGGAPGP